AAAPDDRVNALEKTPAQGRGLAFLQRNSALEGYDATMGYNGQVIYFSANMTLVKQVAEQPEGPSRRTFLQLGGGALGLGLFSAPARALQADDTFDTVQTDGELLTSAQAQAFRQWFSLIVAQQFRRGPTPRWLQRDCAGLVRFACSQALRRHDESWLKANGFWGRPTPPEVGLQKKQMKWGQLWQRVDGSQGNWVGALELVQANTHWVGKELNRALTADLLFFDQGDAQHLMIWMGNYIAYHNGSHSA
ncbi:unnamed protein product, partial [Darwinula stevensoni]